MLVYFLGFLLFVVLLVSLFILFLVKSKVKRRVRYLLVPLFSGLSVVAINYLQLFVEGFELVDYGFLAILVEDLVKILLIAIFSKILLYGVEKDQRLGILVLVAFGGAVGFAAVENFLFFLKKIESLTASFLILRAILPTFIHIILFFSYTFVLFPETKRDGKYFIQGFGLGCILLLHFSYNLIFSSQLFSMSKLLYYINILVFVVLITGALFLIAKRILSKKEERITFEMLSDKNRRK
ncbi:MAG: PrsW family intramembrane metalloprotease [Spirochaetales bacterium]|nr:PrsW family intramembrane metalloprotease [Spirochaetales bacterium]